MNFADAHRYLNGRLRFGVKLGNDRVLALLERMGNPHLAVPMIHIAGTKGKGSTATLCASVLHAAGYKTGVYLSPNVYDVRERVQMNGEPIPEEEFARIVTQLQPHVEALEQTEHGPATEFELKTVLGFCYFRDQKVDYAVIEVGLGGRLDATNVIPQPRVSVITAIGLDHTEILGNTLSEIAREKAGIVKRGVPCVTSVAYGSEPYTPIAAICGERGASITTVCRGYGDDGCECGYDTAADGTLTLWTSRRRLSGIRLSLLGHFQHENAAVAAAALDAITVDAPVISDEAMCRGLESATLPGRLQKVLDFPTVVVDVAHNELSARVLRQALAEQFDSEQRKTILVVGMSKGHAPESFIGPLADMHPALFVATQPEFHPRDAHEVAECAVRLGISDVRVVESSVTNAVRVALAEASPDDLICLTGSFFTVGEVPPAAWTELAAEGK